MSEALDDADPSNWRVSQVIALDWYDGAREGICRLSFPECEFLFRLLDERPTEDGLDDRLFSVATLPPGSVEEALSLLSFLGEPASSTWAPIWLSPDALRMEAARRAIDAMLAQAKETDIIIRTSDFETFLGRWQSHPQGEVRNWFDELGLKPL